MKTLTFTYTKKDGSVSSRYLLVQSRPSEMYAGVDLSEMDESEAADFIEQANKLQLQYHMDMEFLKESFDLKHNYRQFLASCMSNIEEI
jgi:hypothetical protein